MSSAGLKYGARPFVASKTVPVALLAAVFFATYLSWRPSLDILFSLSDMLFIVAAGQLMARRRVPFEPFGVLTPVWLGAFTVMMTGLLIGSLGSSDPTRWLTVASQYAFAWVLLPFLLMGHEKAVTDRLSFAMVAGVVCMEMFGIIVAQTYQGSFEEARNLLGFDFLSGNGRLGAFVTDANWNGAAISMSLPFVFYLAGKGRMRPWLAILSIAVLVFALLLTASFTAFASAIAAVLIYFVAGAVRPRISVTLIALAFAAGAVTTQVGLPAAFQHRVAPAVGSGDITEAGTFEGRVALIRDAWRVVGDHMIVGVGVDQDRVVSSLRAPVHNMYLLIWVEGGLVALIGWIGLMAVFLMIAFGAVSRDRLAGGLAISVMATFLLFSTASPHMYARLWAVPVLLALAVARNCGRAVSSDRQLGTFPKHRRGHGYLARQ